MTPSAQAALQSGWQAWSLPIPLTLLLLAAAVVYLCGWWHLRAGRSAVIPAWRAGCFGLGLLLIWVALGSPLSVFDEQLLTVHMIQHLLLMTIAPPLILLGEPLMPLLHGLPRKFVQVFLGPILRWAPLQRVGRFLAHPAVCWIAAAAALVGWHVPAAFTLGLQSEAWHVVEHSCFLFAGFLFWWPVIQPWPSSARANPMWSPVAGNASVIEAVVRNSEAGNPVATRLRAERSPGVSEDLGHRSSGWWLLLYLFLATIPCDILSAFLVFSDRLVYPIYVMLPRQFAIPALEDQQCAAALMWTCVTVAYLIPAMILTMQLMGVRHGREERARLESAK
ncbi:MAG: cytochrome c oxidase assembly protein [Candidatus Acidiferrum sp.]|jgi:cytochrome c oxidase assembly factor CtaG